MKKLTTLTALVLLGLQYLMAQDSVQLRVILIGDAGEINPAQRSVIDHAISNNIPGKTIALFLGDNIYPKGMELSGAKMDSSLAILRSQFEGLRKNNIPVYFVPGNHDWDKSGPNGYKKIIAANEYIQSLEDSALQMTPADGCPGPAELHLSNNVVLITMDSEWWLYPFNKYTEEADCACKTKRDILGKLTDIIERNRNKVILFATHHPFHTYGSHGGYYTLKQHLFPFTELNKNLYIPLPIIGSLYPFLRKTFPPAEDPGHVLYKDMIRSVENVLKEHANVIHVSGHEHSLQLIQGTLLQVVSGAGCKHTPVRMGKGSIYAADSSGYVLADIMKDNSTRLSFYTFNNKHVNGSFVYNKAYTKPLHTEEAAISPSFGDSLTIPLKPLLDSVSKSHRRLFGENYRKAWATPTTIPILRLSSTTLTPTEAGGGMQTKSLRLVDDRKKEWVLRSLEKYPDALLPQALSQTLAAYLVKDNMSANFPYGALTVPVFANASGVPHSNPTIAYLAPDKKLGIYSRDFANTIVLLEEREPLGKSLSTIKMQDALKKDNDNTIDQHAFLRARLQDIFLGDWDRHADQWRWVNTIKGKDNKYAPVPRDRDQVFYVNQGFFPKLLALPWIMPKFEGFKGSIRNINEFAFNARLIDGLFMNNINATEWTSTTEQVMGSFTDSVIEAAIKKIPAAIYEQYGASLTKQLKERRSTLQRTSSQYYRFLSKIVDITTSNKNEQVTIRDTLNGMLSLTIHKITKEHDTGKVLYYRIFDPSITKEINLYLYKGEDLVNISNHNSPIRIRVIGHAGSDKQYSFSGQPQYLRRVSVYEGKKNATFSGQHEHVRKYLSNKQHHTNMVITERYNRTMPLLAMGYNIDDGFLMGAGVKWIRHGFRKTPYASAQQFMFSHSFSSGAFSVKYNGEWLHALNKADIVLSANILAPDNTQNFFGLGNRSVLNKTGDFRRFYRTRFNIVDISPILRWRSEKGKGSLSIGPTLQYYHLDPSENNGRFITNTSLLHSYDSATIDRDKTHAGIIAAYTLDNRNNKLIPTFGSHIKIQLQAYTGLNNYSRSFGQLTVQIAGYKSVDHRSNIVIANRLGAGISVGSPTFYQSLFLGGHENLLGFRQFRFGGEHMLFNNFEARIKLADLASYLLPGQLGIVGFYDVGKVWQKGHNDKRWHQGVGGGFYFSPAQLFLIQLVVGGSREGLLPYFTAGFRF